LASELSEGYYLQHGLNYQKNNIPHGAETINILDHICGIFEQENESNETSGNHSFLLS